MMMTLKLGIIFITLWEKFRLGGKYYCWRGGGISGVQWCTPYSPPLGCTVQWPGVTLQISIICRSSILWTSCLRCLITLSPLYCYPEPHLSPHQRLLNFFNSTKKSASGATTHLPRIGGVRTAAGGGRIVGGERSRRYNAVYYATTWTWV